MNQYLLIICFLLGTLAGAGLTFFGFYVGFKISYDIRNNRDGIVNDDGLLGPESDPSELDLIEEEEKEKDF